MGADAFETDKKWLQWFNSPTEVSVFRAADGLQPAEQAIADALRARLPKMDMLDVGVGAGRTTGPFASLVKRYVGIDYAPAMIESCRNRFPELEFAVGNASAMPEFERESFDFVLFSYNGLDCISEKGRQKALEEFRRVLRPGGYLAFSSHNMNFLPRFAQFRLSTNPRRMAGSLRRWFLFRLHNRGLRLRSTNACAVYEGYNRYSVAMFYIQANHQVSILKSMGMEVVSVFPKDSSEPADMTNLQAIQVPWIYYLCRKPL